MSIFAIKMKLILGRRCLFLDLGGVGVSGTPLGVTQKSFELFAFWLPFHWMLAFLLTDTYAQDDNVRRDEFKCKKK